MAIVLIAPKKNNLKYWQEKLREEASRQGEEVPVWVWPEVPEPEKIKMAVVWKHPHQSLYQFPELRLVSSMGAGVDHIMQDKNMPSHWQITRIVDEQLTRSMSNYLLAAVLGYHKRMEEYPLLQQQNKWGYSDEPERPIRIGILGMGTLGTDIARKLVALGFPVSGYSHSRKEVPGVRSFAGQPELLDFLQQVNVLICLLPLTSETRGFLNLQLFKNCRKGTFLINVARGEHLVEDDLLQALEKGYIGTALLDVFQKEPLPEVHPFWNHPSILITPHIASVTQPDAAIPQIIANYLRMMAGEKLQNQVDRQKEY
ncbi:2-hydroxyacid dehydrogenase [Nafulsella turpanensis]|uniref:2-hydroxyacid dehydrogenase n=1 Tax=Nafulsella turpanensis TaxID=1265690 RepID=UPI000348BEB7|nr:glyoxylate/hydroxypyruvate reductase A [Nafulsella turpanensis]